MPEPTTAAQTNYHRFLPCDKDMTHCECGQRWDAPIHDATKIKPYIIEGGDDG